MALLGACGLILNGHGGDLNRHQLQPDDVFQATSVWSVHFGFTPDQWAEMEPKGGLISAILSLLTDRERGRMKRFQMPRSFRMGTLLAPTFLKAGDLNGDNRLSEEEFSALGEKWFGEWDSSASASLRIEQVRAGLNAALGQGIAGLGSVPGFHSGSFLQASDGKRNGLASAMGIQFKYVHADMEFENLAFPDVAIRYKGNSTFIESRASLKRSLKVDLNDFVKGQKLAGATKLNFHNNVSDPSFVREVLAFRLFRDAGVPAPQTAYAMVRVTVPGKFDRKLFGLYSMVENIDKAFTEEHYAFKSGAIFKPSTRSLFTDLGDDWKNYVQAYDPKTELSAAQEQRVIDFCKFVSHVSDADFEKGLGSFIDLDEFARFMAVTVYLSSMDSILGIGQNYYVYLNPKTAQFQFFAWDQDHAFGDFLIPGGGPVGTLSIHHPCKGRMNSLNAYSKWVRSRTPTLGVWRNFQGHFLPPIGFADRSMRSPRRFDQGWKRNQKIHSRDSTNRYQVRLWAVVLWGFQHSR